MPTTLFFNPDKVVLVYLKHGKCCSKTEFMSSNAMKYYMGAAILDFFISTKLTRVRRNIGTSSFAHSGNEFFANFLPRFRISGNHSLVLFCSFLHTIMKRSQKM